MSTVRIHTLGRTPHCFARWLMRRSCSLLILIDATAGYRVARGILESYWGDTEVVRGSRSIDQPASTYDSLHQGCTKLPSWNQHMPTLPAATLRRLSAAHDVDPRSILRELREPGSVRGMAGERARKALSAHQAKVAAAHGTEVR